MTVRSVNTNLVGFTNFAIDIIEGGSQVDVVFMQTSARLRVKHISLWLKKLSVKGINAKQEKKKLLVPSLLKHEISFSLSGLHF